MKKISNRQDVESAEGSKVCNPDQDICYGTLTISNVNVTLEGFQVVDFPHPFSTLISSKSQL